MRSGPNIRHGILLQTVFGMAPGVVHHGRRFGVHVLPREIFGN